MKIYILGPSASGKSTLSKRLATQFNCRVYHSDFILSEYEGRSKTKLSDGEYMKKINKVLSKENWIFEGKHIIPNLLEAANNILWLKTPLITTLFRQWKRYFTDKNQRERFTFLNNLQLTKVILSQYLGEENLDKKDNPRYAHQKKFKRVLKEYKRKVVEVKNEEDVKEFISGLLNS